MHLKEDIQVHNNLNPKLFEKGKLKDEIRDKIIEIVLNFEHYIDFPISIVDIQLVGSNASYNYTEQSDIDIHIIANFDVVSHDTALLQSLYDAKKSAFNKDFDITIKGLEVELYVENIKSNVVSNGIYSVCDNEWVKKPIKITDIPRHNLSGDIAKWSNKIEEVLTGGQEEDIVNMINALYLLRKNSIASEGEWGRGNQLFKELRNLGLIKQLKDAYKKKISKKLSLESLRSGKIMRMLDD